MNRERFLKQLKLLMKNDKYLNFKRAFDNLFVSYRRSIENSRSYGIVPESNADFSLSVRDFDCLKYVDVYDVQKQLDLAYENPQFAKIALPREAVEEKLRILARIYNSELKTVRANANQETLDGIEKLSENEELKNNPLKLDKIIKQFVKNRGEVVSVALRDKMLRFIDELEMEMREFIVEPYRKAYYSSEREKYVKKLEGDEAGEDIQEQSDQECQ